MAQATEFLADGENSRAHEDGTRVSRRQAIVLCPVCDTPLTIPDGIRDQGTVFQSRCPAFRASHVGDDSISPIEDKDIVPVVMQYLCGFDPAALMFMAQKAAEFWMYQQRFTEEQSSTALMQQANKAKDDAQAAQMKLTEVQNNLQAEQRKTALVMEECEEQRSKADDMQEKIVELTRQKRKLTELYNSLKARHQELVNKLGKQQPQGKSDEEGEWLHKNSTEVRVQSSRSSLLASQQLAEKTVPTTPAVMTVGRATPAQCLFPSDTQTLQRRTQASAPLKRPSCIKSSGGGIVLDLTSTKRPPQPIVVKKHRAPSSSSQTKPPSEKKKPAEYADKWDLLSSCFDIH